MKRWRGIILLMACMLSSRVWGQISPPGLGTANTVGWFAMGIRQELDTLKAWQSVTYVGLGRKSNPDNYNPFYKASIFVLNQEFYHQFHHHWQYSFALSYRQQDAYDNQTPYEREVPSFEREFRTYGRLSYTIKTSRLKFTSTFRQELRKFYAPDFSASSENFQLRSRLRLQLTLNLDAQKRHRLVSSLEGLFAISKETSPAIWSPWGYRESRFTLYYSLSLPHSPLIFDLGYMNDLVGASSMYSAHYLCFDIILENPMKLLKRKKERIQENLE